MKKTKLLLAYLDRWEEVDAYEAFSYEGHLFYVHKTIPFEKEGWKVSHACGAAAGLIMPTRAAAIKRALLDLQVMGITKENLDRWVKRLEEQMEDVVRLEQKNKGGSVE